MTPLHQQQWFIDTVTFCRKWKWFDTYIYGKSKDMEDFVRNPAEVLRDEVPPFVFKDVSAPKSLLLLRLGYIPYYPLLMSQYLKEIREFCGFWPNAITGTYHKVDVGTNGKTFTIKDLTYDILWNNPWCTKYPNAAVMIQLACSFKNHMPIPWFGMTIHYSRDKYFQFGIGWGPQRQGYLDPTKTGIETGWDASLNWKFRLASYLDELRTNPGAEVFWVYEGTT